MIGWGTLTGGLSVIQGLFPLNLDDETKELIMNDLDFPWKDLPNGTTFCDVGAAVGHVAMELANAYPHIHLTVQDLPNVIDQAKEV